MGNLEQDPPHHDFLLCPLENKSCVNPEFIFLGFQATYSEGCILSSQASDNDFRKPALARLLSNQSRQNFKQAFLLPELNLFSKTTFGFAFSISEILCNLTVLTDVVPYTIAQ